MHLKSWVANFSLVNNSRLPFYDAVSDMQFINLSGMKYYAKNQQFHNSIYRPDNCYDTWQLLWFYVIFKYCDNYTVLCTSNFIEYLFFKQC